MTTHLPFFAATVRESVAGFRAHEEYRSVGAWHARTRAKSLRTACGRVAPRSNFVDQEPSCEDCRLAALPDENEERERGSRADRRYLNNFLHGQQRRIDNYGSRG